MFSESALISPTKVRLASKLLKLRVMSEARHEKGLATTQSYNAFHTQ